MKLPCYTPIQALELVRAQGDGKVTDDNGFTYWFCSQSGGATDDTAAEAINEEGEGWVPEGEPWTPLAPDAKWVRI